MSTNWANPEAWAEFYPGSKKRRDLPVPMSTVDTTDKAEWDNPRVLKIAGEPIEFFSTGQLALALGGRSPVTMRAWEASGTIPRPKYWAKSPDPRGKRRLYTRAQLEGMVKIAAEEGLLDKNSKKPIRATRFTERVVQLYKSLED